jgi:hypothetical protein
MLDWALHFCASGCSFSHTFDPIHSCDRCAMQVVINTSTHLHTCTHTYAHRRTHGREHWAGGWQWRSEGEASRFDPPPAGRSPSTAWGVTALAQWAGGWQGQSEEEASGSIPPVCFSRSCPDPGGQGQEISWPTGLRHQTLSNVV